MKKISILAVFAATCSLASAITVNAPASLVGANVLDGQKAYAWGIPITLAAGQTVTSASVSFNNITLTGANSSGTGVLYTDLLKSTQTGVHVFTDNNAAGDYFATQYAAANIVNLGSKVFASVGTTLSWTYTLNSTQLAALNVFLANGIFNLGFDPDCHYTVGGISFTYTKSPINVPDVATTIYMLGLALLGLEVSRRKFALAK